jgi:hypothetical protein
LSEVRLVEVQGTSTLATVAVIWLSAGAIIAIFRGGPSFGH